MSTDLTVTPMQALEEKKSWSTALAGSNLLPRDYQKAPANLLLAAEYADALGVPRMAALTGIHVIKGKPSMSADLMLALVRRAGHRIRVSGDDTHAEAILIRADDPDYEYRAVWTMEEAQRAGLLGKPGGNWEHYPGPMLRARSVTEVVRMGASEVLFGAIYAPEELGVQVDETGTPIDESAPSPAPQVQPEPQPEVPLASQELMDEISAYAKELNLTKDQVLATAKYCGHDGTTPTPTLEVGQAMADYLKRRRDEAAAKRADAQQSAESEEIVDAEIVEEPATLAQLQKLNILLEQLLGSNDRDAKLNWLSGRLNREVMSSKDLTKAEATEAIEDLLVPPAEAGEPA